ncbi:hypothetical protein GCM10009827_083930 [Dactylosporangium maewongense]|uniref:Uncharacterized protein n=1 Tax=Dactylosporangium maewongense TaxID=634393 RepID=A0ABN2C317_9ACTN
MSDHGTDVLPDGVEPGAWAPGQPGRVTPARVGPDGTGAAIDGTASYRRRGKADEYDAELEATNETTNKLKAVFYVLVLLTALGGQVTGAVEVLGVPWWVALPAVSVLELGGVVIMRTAEVRRRLGESAVFVYLLAVGIAAFATGFNWVAHEGTAAGAFFAFMSLVGFLVWALSTEHRRRDRLRATGQMSDLPPRYELFTHWMRRPFVTLRARSMAKADPRLGLVRSLIVADQAMRRDRRLRGISRVLKRKIRKAVDPVTAGIAVNVYDLDRVAQELERRADYVGLTDLIAADLVPSRIAANQAPVKVEAIVGNPAGRKIVREQVMDVVQEAVAATLSGQLAAIEAATSAATERLEVAATSAASRHLELTAAVADPGGQEGGQVADEMAADVTGEVAAEVAEEPGGDQREPPAAPGQSEAPSAATEQRRPRPTRSSSSRSAAANKVAAALAKNPNLTVAQLAAKFATPERTIRRHVAAMRSATEPVNGHDHGAGQ